MNTNRLSEKMRAALNSQMTKEGHASQIYLSYGAWAAGEGYDGIANFLWRHAQEERNHMIKIMEYILERGAKVKVEAIPAPSESFDEGDWATRHFMQWFVKEQSEEETLALNLLDKIKIAGGEKATGSVLYSIDRDLEKAPDDAKLAEEKTAMNP